MREACPATICPGFVAPDEHIRKAVEAVHGFSFTARAADGDACGDDRHIAIESDLSLVQIVSACELVTILFASEVLLFCGRAARRIEEPQRIPASWPSGAYPQWE